VARKEQGKGREHCLLRLPWDPAKRGANSNGVVARKSEVRKSEVMATLYPDSKVWDRRLRDARLRGLRATLQAAALFPPAQGFSRLKPGCFVRATFQASGRRGSLFSFAQRPTSSEDTPILSSWRHFSSHPRQAAERKFTAFPPRRKPSPTPRNTSDNGNNSNPASRYRRN